MNELEKILHYERENVDAKHELASGQCCHSQISLSQFLAKNHFSRLRFEFRHTLALRNGYGIPEFVN